MEREYKNLEFRKEVKALAYSLRPIETRAACM
jgi:hypothetical protein